MSTDKKAVDSGDSAKLALVMRFLKLLGQILIWIADGKRSLSGVVRLFQLINDRPDFERVLDIKDATKVVVAKPTKTVAALVSDALQPGNWALDYQRFYHEVFGLEVDFSEVEIPDDPGGFGWVVFVVKGLTLDKVWANCRKAFPSKSSLGNKLDRVVTSNDRTSTEKSYAKRFRNQVEADWQNETFSAISLAKLKIQTNTLLERLILEQWYYWKTGKHLDSNKWTLCAGSCCKDGDIPNVHWSYGHYLSISSSSPNDNTKNARSVA